MAQLLITGGSGFIGSHTALVILETSRGFLVLDDFSHSSAIALTGVRELSGAEAASQLRHCQATLRTQGILSKPSPRHSPGLLR